MHRLRASILATGLMLTAPLFAQTLAPERVLNDVNVLADSCTQASDSRQALDSAALTRALSSPERDVTDFLRDETRKPVQTLEFLALERGMRVLDLYAAGGYYTVVLSQAVGESGCVFAQNTQRGRAFIEDRQAITQGEALDTKIRTANLNNVTQLIAPTTSLDIAPESLDFILLTLRELTSMSDEELHYLMNTLSSRLKDKIYYNIKIYNYKSQIFLTQEHCQFLRKIRF